MGHSVYAHARLDHIHIEASYLSKLYVPYLFELSMLYSESKCERQASGFPIYNKVNSRFPI